MEDGEDIDALMKNADIAMYAAKEKGRDNYQRYGAVRCPVRELSCATRRSPG